jgi:hypothetical protein
MVAEEVALAPILKMVVELLSDQKRELQAAGCLGLAQVYIHWWLPSCIS